MQNDHVLKKSNFVLLTPTPGSRGCPEGGGHSDIFTHTRPGLFFGVQNSEFQYFWGILRKVYIFFGGGYEDFVDIFGGHHKIGLV